MSVEDFLAWEETQDRKWELVDGAPVLRETRLMAGGTPEHARIAANVIIALGAQLRGGPCAPYTSDLKVQAGANIRYPDVTVDCGTPRGEKTAATPRVLIEVLSPSNNAFMQTRLLADYQSMDSVEEIVFLSQETAEAQSWRRAANGWMFAEHLGQEAVIDLASIGARLELAAAYDGVAVADPTPPT